MSPRRRAGGRSAAGAEEWRAVLGDGRRPCPTPDYGFPSPIPKPRARGFGRAGGTSKWRRHEQATGRHGDATQGSSRRRREGESKGKQKLQFEKTRAKSQTLKRRGKITIESESKRN
uniref:Uncharacterized protein n=1 Tax=Oryza meridionalis TaxID=40149 RepID=A0A0E0EJ05_9ORYZ